MKRVVMEMQNQRESSARPELVLRGAGDSEVEVLLGHREMLAGLVRLDLSHCDVGLDALGRLFGVLEPGVLEELALEGVALGDAGARLIARAPSLAGVRVLGLAFARVGEEGAMELARSPVLERLEALDLWGNRLGPRTREAIEEAPRRHALRWLRTRETWHDREPRRRGH